MDFHAQFGLVTPKATTKKAQCYKNSKAEYMLNIFTLIFDWPLSLIALGLLAQKKIITLLAEENFQREL